MILRLLLVVFGDHMYGVLRIHMHGMQRIQLGLATFSAVALFIVLWPLKNSSYLVAFDVGVL